ncbi:MAG: site-specific integrase [Pseudomonadota bacterium]
MSILQECFQCHKKQAMANDSCICGNDLLKSKKSKKTRYWINYRMPNGKQKREFSGYSFSSAKSAEGKRQSQKAEGRILDIKTECKMTFKELTDWYIKQPPVKKLASFDTIKISMKKFNHVFGNTPVVKLKVTDLEKYQETRKEAGLAGGTIDHEIGKTQAAIKKAIGSDLIPYDCLKPFTLCKSATVAGEGIRDRVLTKDEFERIMDNLPRYAKNIFATAYHTGMRKGEIINLKWDRLDLKEKVIRLKAQDTKTKQPRNIPISGPLYKILKSIIRPIHIENVFLYEGKSIKNINRSLKTAVEKAGLVYGRFKKDGIILHDCRHTFTTNMRKAGVDRATIMKITGHTTESMFHRYNKVDTDDVTLAVDQLDKFLQSVDKSVDQEQKRS